MKVIRPFSAALSAFRANSPSFGGEAGSIQNWVTIQLTNRMKRIEESTSFSVKELKEYEKLNLKERPEKLTYEDALCTVVSNQEIVVHKRRNLVLNSYIPGAGAMWTFASAEVWLLFVTQNLHDTLILGGPMFALSMLCQHIVRCDLYSSHFQKLKMAHALKALSDKVKCLDDKTQQQEVKTEPKASNYDVLVEKQ